jgi:cytochrome o ubiquinol oxidase subunit III
MITLDQSDPHHLGHDKTSSHRQHTEGHADGGLVSKRIITGYGFWIFLLSDIIMFSAFFASYAVLVGNTAGGPTGRDLFKLSNVALETSFLLLSSFTVGLAGIYARAYNRLGFNVSMAATFLLGAAFLTIEILEFVELISLGAGPTRSAFLSAFFTLVGCHGLHIIAGLLWLLTWLHRCSQRGSGQILCGAFSVSTCFGTPWT